jgi:predicted component of type VI protein secretion system
MADTHCVIENYCPDGVYVLDSGSGTGTFLDGGMVDGRRRLRTGSVLRLGETEMHVRISEFRELPVDGDVPLVEIPQVSEAAVAEMDAAALAVPSEDIRRSVVLPPNPDQGYVGGMFAGQKAPDAPEVRGGRVFARPGEEPGRAMYYHPDARQVQGAPRQTAAEGPRVVSSDVGRMTAQMPSPLSGDSAMPVEDEDEEERERRRKGFYYHPERVQKRGLRRTDGSAEPPPEEAPGFEEGRTIEEREDAAKAGQYYHADRPSSEPARGPDGEPGIDEDGQYYMPGKKRLKREDDR